MKALIRFLLSLKTAFGIYLILIIISFVGSVILPKNLAFFSGIDDTTLFQWLAQEDRPGLTWWIYALIGAFAFMGISTVFCTVDALLGLGRKNLIARLSPQVMHLGVLFVMLGHLLTAWVGHKADINIAVGEKRDVQSGMSFYLEDIREELDEAGYAENWEAEIWVYRENEKIAEKVIRPARPAHIGQTGFFIKTVSAGENPSALIKVNRDPGAIWALSGGLLVCLGGIGFVYGRLKI